jgi:mono/diheme cytochrome c family protein
VRTIVKNNWKALRLSVVSTLCLFAVPGVNLFAQGGGRGRGAAPIVNVPPPTSPVTGNAARGKTVFLAYGCYACHGYNGETGARNFVGRWGNLQTEQQFITFLRGRANVTPLTPVSSMPNFSAQSLPDEKAKDLYAYIRTFKSTAPASKSVPALDDIVASVKAEK